MRLLAGNVQEPLGLERKRTADGIILEPQPNDNPNDPLNWPSWRRDCALLALGWHCLLGGGQTPVLAAGFKDVAETFDVTIPQVALTTGKCCCCRRVYFISASGAFVLYVQYATRLQARGEKRADWTANM